jgi:hypothetical protein
MVIIIFLLAVIAFRPMMFSQTVAAQQHYTYIAVRPSNVLRPQLELDKYASEGWELVATYNAELNFHDTQLIFRK